MISMSFLRSCPSRDSSTYPFPSPTPPASPHHRRPSHRFVREVGFGRPSMDATLLLLSPDCPAATGRMRRLLSALPVGPWLCCPSPCARPRASVRASAAAAAPAARGLPYHASVAGQNSGVYTVGDFMTKREELYVVKPTTSVDEALEMLVEHRITGFPVIDDDWNLVGVVSDYDLLALDSISGTGLAEADIFPEVDSTWKTFREIQRLLSKTNGRVIADVMTSAPLVVRETTNLEDAARLLLETKYRRLPVVDSAAKLVGIITRGNVVRAALEIKKKVEDAVALDSNLKRKGLTIVCVRIYTKL